MSLTPLAILVAHAHVQTMDGCPEPADGSPAWCLVFGLACVLWLCREHVALEAKRVLRRLAR